MRFSRLVLPAIVLVLAGTSLTLAAAKPRVSMELATEEGFSITGAQPWYKLLTELGVSNLRIRSGNAKDEMAVQKQGGDFKVLGFLKADGTLHVPGGKFTSRDSAKLKKWLGELADQGAEGVTQPKIAFGLLP